MEYHQTSVSLREKSYRRLKAAQLIFARHGIKWGEGEIISRLCKETVLRWRSGGPWTVSARRYNIQTDEIKYVIRPWRVDKNLYGVLWQRTIHSGESVSRFVDFAIRVFMPRFVEMYLHSPRRGSAFSARNHHFWAARYARRKSFPDYFINYQKATEKNENGGLETARKAVLIAKKGLSYAEYIHCLRTCI